ncbi:MAG: aspartate/glutamate racemase family protein [Pseudomonadota bacterium]
MNILVINPNTTASMTEAIGREAEKAARPGTTILATNPKEGPEAIQGPEDGEAALPYLFKTFDKMTADQDVDAVVIACFDDTGLFELKARATIPVVGIGEAAYHAAMLAGARFTVVTTLPVSVPVLEDNIRNYGFEKRCAKVRATNIPVLELERSPDASEEKIRLEIQTAIKEDKCDAIALGCAGMSELGAKLEAEFGIPLIDGVKSAIGLCEMLISSKEGRAS